jgi:AICAR transformylase/IMP cyclohydrolase PurH
MIRPAARIFRCGGSFTRRLHGHRGRDAQFRGAISRETKWRLAQKAFRTTAEYDSVITARLGRWMGRRPARGLISTPISTRRN